jgi:hypothetical protein
LQSGFDRISAKTRFDDPAEFYPNCIGLDASSAISPRNQEIDPIANRLEDLIVAEPTFRYFCRTVTLLYDNVHVNMFLVAV